MTTVVGGWPPRRTSLRLARDLEVSHTGQLQFCPQGLVYISKIDLRQVEMKEKKERISF